MTINKKKRGYLSFILSLSLSIGITGCTKITTKNNVKEEVKVKEVEEEKVLASVKTSYIEMTYCHIKQYLSLSMIMK